MRIYSGVCPECSGSWEGTEPGQIFCGGDCAEEAEDRKKECPISSELRIELTSLARELKVTLDWMDTNTVRLTKWNENACYFIGTWEGVCEEILKLMKNQIKEGEHLVNYHKNEKVKELLLIGLNWLRERCKKFDDTISNLF